jgi:hypothetical protein
MYVQCSNHWICIIIDLDRAMAWVLDSMDKDEDTYVDFINILETYVYTNHPD